MQNTYTRPMTEAERNYVAELLLRYTQPARSLASQRAGLFWRGLGLVVLCMATALFVVRFLARGNISAIGLTLVAAIVIAVALLDQPPNYGEEHSKRCAAQLAQRLVRGEVEVTEVTATEVICLKHEKEEEYVSFLFDIGDNQALHLDGEHLIVETKEESISLAPRDGFDIIRYPDTPETIVRIDFKGNPLPISRTITWTNYAPISDLPDGEVLTGVTLATIEQDRPDLFENPSGDHEG